MFVSLVSNDGKRLEPLEEAEAFRRLTAWGVPVKDIARRMGRSSVFIYQRLKLVDASPELKQAIEEKEVSVGTAAKIVQESAGNPMSQKQGIAKAKAQEKITISFSGKSEGKIKSKDETDTIHIKELFKAEFIDEMEEMNADISSVKIVFKVKGE